MLWIPDDRGEKTNRNQQWSESLFPELREILMCYEKEYRCTFSQKKKKKRNNVLRSLPCWYLWVNVTKKPNAVLTTCIVQKTSSHRGKNKGNILYYNHLFSLLVFSLWLKGLPTEDSVDFLPISHPGNTRMTDYQPGTLGSGARFWGSGWLNWPTVVGEWERNEPEGAPQEYFQLCHRLTASEMKDEWEPHGGRGREEWVQLAEGSFQLKTSAHRITESQ